ncbi:MAG TPA: phosphotransferase [Devosia sp.]|nr:phosphotransferase [Devosia sp.]
MSLTSARLPGGTEAAGVFRVVASYDDDRGKLRQRRLIIKHLTGRARREASILQDLGSGCRLLPELLGIVRGNEGHIYLGLEDVRRASVWPWRDSTITATLMRELGQFHETSSHTVPGDAWDYEHELGTQSEQTCAWLAHYCRQPDFAALRPGLRAVERVAEELPRLRKLLLGERPFEAGLIHGDVHPGNALIRNGAGKRPVLIDWGRTRRGSPLEDVSSMLQSLRFYEPTALQRHDTLLKEYLTGRGRDRRITDGLRSVYWVAGASNALAGALAWHLMIAADEAKPALQRKGAYWAARDWMRVIRRAHAWAL